MALTFSYKKDKLPDGTGVFRSTIPIDLGLPYLLK